jgi:hypothetical protein
LVRSLWLFALAACGARTELGVGRSDQVELDASHDAPDVSAPVEASIDDCGAVLASNTTWQTPFGFAQPVCLNPSQPANCPSGALLYGGNLGWSANLSSVPGAVWIWRPGITVTDPSDGAQVTFSHTYVLHGLPSGTLSLGADDFAEIHVNDVVVGSVGSITDKTAASASQSMLTVFALDAYLVDGANTITIVGQNGPPSFAGCAGACSYAQNPAGVVFGGGLSCH